MRSAFDFAPLFRSSVGFDRIANVLEAMSRVDDSSLGYPPYNIEKYGDDSYRITMAVAGFGLDDLEIETQEGKLTVRGRLDSDDEEQVYLHRGIAGRAFERTFQLADYVKVQGANLQDGLLHIELIREVPEALKPRTIEIATSTPKKIANKTKKLFVAENKAA